MMFEPAKQIGQSGSVKNAPGITIIVPFYRSIKHLQMVSQSLHGIVDELKAHDAHIVFIDDSPDDKNHSLALAKTVRTLAPQLSIEAVINIKNLGFIKSTNKGLEIARQRGDHALLLNSDTILCPGAITEMWLGLDHDTMVGFVSPRSNNAALCSLPPLNIRIPSPENSSPAEHALRHADISRFLPRFSYVPTVIGFCLLMRRNVLDNFGNLDEIYGRGYEEENDLIMRANRYGYRALLANRAFVYHDTLGAFGAEEKSKLKQKNAKTLLSRYPEFLRGIQQHNASPQAQGETILSERSLRTSQGETIEIAIEGRMLSTHKNGTSKVISTMVEALSKCTQGSQIRLSLICVPATASLHNLDQMDGLALVEEKDAYGFDVFIKFGQPFTTPEFWDASQRAVHIVYSMFDTIAWDCLYLRNPDLDALWRSVADLSDAILFISPFTEQQFLKRFPTAPAVKTMITELSLDAKDYIVKTAPEVPVSETQNVTSQDILIFGNHFYHKFVLPTTEHLAQHLKTHRIVMFGLKKQTNFANVVSIASGALSEAEIDQLYRNASCVVFPSTYEGFGLPVVEALARNRTVYIRDTPLNRWIKTNWNGPGEVHFFTTLDELTESLKDAIASQEKKTASTSQTIFDGSCLSNSKSWNHAALKILSLVSSWHEDTLNTQFWRRLDQEHRLKTYALTLISTRSVPT